MNYSSWTDEELVEEMLFWDTEGYAKPLRITWHCAKWYAIESILRRRHGDNWNEVLSRKC